ncbi:hypothetical protein AOX55_0000753 [Sinorhizobium fredii CCBAU 25509]|nr:hypothetical protein AOX55_0000753 [Sinorhizobium fredii CCBAU 25509]
MGEANFRSATVFYQAVRFNDTTTDRSPRKRYALTPAQAFA